MKKFFLSLCSFMILAVAANAQTAEPAKADKAAEKEAKAKMKQKQAEDVEKALAEAGVSAEAAAKFKDAMKEYSGKSSEVKKNAALTDAEKEVQLKAITEEKNQKLAEIIGPDKYKLYNAARKKQKEADAATATSK